MIIKILFSTILCILSGILYRMGGKGKPYNTLYRDLGTPLCGLLLLLIWFRPETNLGWWMLLPHYILAYASMTTYWDYIFGYDNFYFHGFMAGLASFPLYWSGIHWYSILIGTLSCGVLMGIWSDKEDNDLREEFGRGFIYTLTRLFLLI